MVFVAEEQTMKLYDEMPTHVLAEYKDVGDSSVLKTCLCTFSYFSSVQVTEWPPIGE